MKNFYLVLAILMLNQPLTVAGAEAGIVWNAWEIAAFEQARRENKPILLSVGMEGCAACARMQSQTYTDAGVIRRVNDHFVAIAVDAEARPDIGERYSDWAWPATIFLAPDATQVLAIRGNRLPRNFVPILDDLIARRSAGKLEPDPDSPYAAPLQPVETDLTRLRDQLRTQLDGNFNHQYGGWNVHGIGGEQSGSRLRNLYLRAHLYNNDEIRQMALKSSAGFLNAIDPVWGGAYSKSIPADAEGAARYGKLLAIPEKRILVQSNAMTAFALGYIQTKDERYLHGMAEIDRYLNGEMQAPDGTFYTNQRSQPANLPKEVSVDDYWLLDSDAKRRRYGTPPIDHAVYTDRNGEVINAYVLAFEATGEVAYLTTATRAADAIIASRLQPEGWVLQTVESEKVRNDRRLRPMAAEEKPFLSAQVSFGSALLALHRASGERRWLETADRIGTQTLKLLHDDELGGFYATVPDATASVIAPRKPLESNGTAASFYYDLWVYTKNDRYQGIPQEAIRAVGQADIIRREGKITGEFANALEKVTAAYVEFSIVGDVAHPNARVLHDAGLDVFEPRKILHYEAPGRYPDRGVPAMYICNPDMCSIPITDPAQVAEQAAAFHGPATSG